ncbi:MAG TPA: hypothetical protein VFJ58_21520 [Armatimonadota bacterium]|nr:hypothetical protein [Armatimonadota bacterium]
MKMLPDRSVVAFWAALLSLMVCAAAPARTLPHVMVSVESINPAYDDVVLTYSVRVSPAQIRSDIDSIARETGWRVGAVHVSSPARGYPGADFMTTHAIRRVSGRLPVAALVTALKQYRDLLLVFDISGAFNYAGNHVYRDRSVDIQMEPQTPQSMTFAFDVHVKNPSFSHLNTPDAMNAGAAPHGSLPSVLVALLIALLIGGGSYLLLSRFMFHAEPNSQ